MKGNNREIQRQKIENSYIEQIDSGKGSHHDPVFLSFLKKQEHHEGPLRVPIFELLTYKASLFNIPLKGGLI